MMKMIYHTPDAKLFWVDFAKDVISVSGGSGISPSDLIPNMEDDAINIVF